jgi:hypothetical protein
VNTGFVRFAGVRADFGAGAAAKHPAGGVAGDEADGGFSEAAREDRAVGDQRPPLAEHAAQPPFDPPDHRRDPQLTFSVADEKDDRGSAPWRQPGDRRHPMRASGKGVAREDRGAAAFGAVRGPGFAVAFAVVERATAAREDE